MEPAGTDSGGQRVLFVDDEKTVCRTLALIFASRGYQARTAGSGEDALEEIAEWSPEVAIIDVGLPKMNGVELAVRIRGRYPGCHILLFSGRPESGDLVAEASATGEGFEIVGKPVHPDFLLRWVRERLQPGA